MRGAPHNGAWGHGGEDEQMPSRSEVRRHILSVAPLLRSKREERVPSQPRRTRSLGGKRRIGAFGLFPESSIQDLESGGNRKLVLLDI